MSSCPITGTATIQEHEGELRWLQADPVIHVSTDLLEKATQAAFEFLTARYKLGEWCPHDPSSRHARRRPYADHPYQGAADGLYCNRDPGNELVDLCSLPRSAHPEVSP